MRRVYPDYNKLAALLPTRTRDAIYHRAARLGLAKRIRRWTADELRTLRPRYPTHEPVASIASCVGRPGAVIRKKASKLKLRRPRRRPVPSNEPLHHAIRQRAFELNITLSELDQAVNARGCFSSPRAGRLSPKALRLALELLGGELRYRRSPL